MRVRKTCVHVLQQKWFSFTKDQNDDIATHISQIGNLCYTLRALKGDISNSMMMTKILMTRAKLEPLNSDRLGVQQRRIKKDRKFNVSVDYRRNTDGCQVKKNLRIAQHSW